MARGGNYIPFSGVIDKVARNQGSFLIIDNGDELWFSVTYAPGGINGAQVGDEVEFEYEEKRSGGKTFNNVKSEVTIVGEGAGEREAPPPRQQRAAPARREAPSRQAPARQAQGAAQGGGSKDDPRQRSIVRQNSLTQANALVASLSKQEEGIADGFAIPSDPLEAAALVVEVARVFEAYSMVEDK